MAYSLDPTVRGEQAGILRTAVKKRTSHLNTPCESALCAYRQSVNQSHFRAMCNAIGEIRHTKSNGALIDVCTEHADWKGWVILQTFVKGLLCS